MEKYNLDFVKEQIPGAPAPAAVTEEPTTTAGVFTPTTPYGTPTGEPLTTAITPTPAPTQPTAPVSDKKALEKQKDALNKLIDDKYGTAYGISSIGLLDNNEFDIVEGFTSIEKGIKVTREEQEEFINLDPKNSNERKEFFKKVAQRRLAEINAELDALEGKPAKPVVEETKEERLAKFNLEMLILELKDVFRWDDNKKSYNRTAKLVKDKNGNTLGVDVLNVDRKVYTIEAANINPELLRQLEEVERKYIFRGQSKEQLSNIKKEARALYKEIASGEIARLTGKEVIPTTEEKIKSLDEAYEDIGNIEQLDEWYQQGIAEQIPAEILDEKRQNKINELAKKINFTDLKDWQEVYVKGDTSPRVVYDPTGEGVKKGEVILLYYGDYLAGDMKSAIKVTPKNINSIIESIPNPAMKEAMPTGSTVTEEQVKESNATVNSLNNPEVVNDTVLKDMVNINNNTDNISDVWNMIDQEIDDNNNCSTGE
jgi:hypothetical protein